MTRRGHSALLASCSAFYLIVATRLTDGLFRRQFDNGAYSHFFDYQAEALLRGDLALPRGAIGIEAFVVDGREQMYFGIFPAILRMPLLAVTDAFFGDLTLLSSFAAWVVFVLSAWALADRCLPLLAPSLADGATLTRAAVVWKLVVGLGSPMLMLAGPAWVFSEAIMWGVAASVLFQYRLLCELQASSTRNQVLLGGALLLAVLNRPAQALGCLAVMVVLIAVRSVRQRALSAREWLLAAMTAAAAVVMVVPNWLRFHRIYGIPMQDHLVTQAEEYRQRMLEYAGEDFTDIRYAPSNVLAYLRPDGISLSSRFPFVNAPREIPTVFFDAVYDITNRTPSIVASSPLLFALTLVGAYIALRCVRSGGLPRQMAFLACAGVPAVGAHVIWGFITPRYLADFLPLMMPLTLVGFAAVAVRISEAAPTPRRWSLAGIVLVAAWSIVANTGLALGSSYYTGYDGDVDEYVTLQGRSDVWGADADERRATPAQFQFDRDHPPAPDRIVVLGDCEAVYISNGEQVDPWLTLDYGANDFRREFSVAVADAPIAVSIPLATFRAVDPPPADRPGSFEVRLAVAESGHVHLELADEFGFVEYPIDGVSAGDEFVLSVTSDPVRRLLFFDVDGTTVAYGHYLTRSLYGPGGQVAEFVDGIATSGAVVDALPSADPC
ncbi:MAG: hypothetical protein WBP59_05825 [Ilumatobacteraceae bacterium]